MVSLHNVLRGRADHLAEPRGHTAQEKLLARLREGLKWLAETHNRLDELPNAGVGMPLEARFLDALDQWDAMDNMVRELYHHQGCIFGHGQRCPDDSPVVCRRCGEHREAGWSTNQGE